jgi:hypothetical protein
MRRPSRRNLDIYYETHHRPHADVLAKYNISQAKLRWIVRQVCDWLLYDAASGRESPEEANLKAMKKLEQDLARYRRMAQQAVEIMEEAKAAKPAGRPGKTVVTTVEVRGLLLNDR